MRMYKKESKYPRIVTKILWGAGVFTCIVALSSNRNVIAQSNAIDCSQYSTEAIQQEKLKLITIIKEAEETQTIKNAKSNIIVKAITNSKNNTNLEDYDSTSSNKVSEVEKPQNTENQDTNTQDTQCQDNIQKGNNSKIITKYTSKSELKKSMEDILRMYTNQDDLKHTESNNQGSNTSDSTNQNTEKPSSNNYNSDYAYQVLDIVNKERGKAGLSPLTMNQKASQAAQVRAKEIVSNFSHTRPNGTSPFTALDRAGATYRAAGENIAYGQSSPTEVMNGWMNSSGHRANILKSDFKEIGIAAYYENGRYYWIQLFIG